MKDIELFLYKSVWVWNDKEFINLKRIKGVFYVLP